MHTLTPMLGLIGPLGWQELGIILLIAVLLFGRRLPDVGRNVGKAIVEFKRGVKGITDEIDAESSTAGSGSSSGREHPAKLDPAQGTAPREAAFRADAAAEAGSPTADPVPEPAARPNPQTS
ncbi:MAG: twin-arginine translocase TatA/TatE family subunit [Planctomycetota bacterium]